MSWHLHLHDLGMVGAVLPGQTLTGTPLANHDFNLRRYLGLPSYLSSVRRHKRLLSFGAGAESLFQCYPLERVRSLQDTEGDGAADGALRPGGRTRRRLCLLAAVRHPLPPQGRRPGRRGGTWPRSTRPSAVSRAVSPAPGPFSWSPRTTRRPQTDSRPKRCCTALRPAPVMRVGRRSAPHRPGIPAFQAVSKRACALPGNEGPIRHSRESGNPGAVEGRKAAFPRPTPSGFPLSRE